MPDTLSLSSGVSLGLLAGIVSGVCYLVANGISWNKTEDKAEQKTKRLSSTPAASGGVCPECGGDYQGGVLPCICLVDKNAAKWIARRIAQTPQYKRFCMRWGICYDLRPVKFEKGAWFLRQTQRALSLMPWSLSTDKLDLIEEEHEHDADGSRTNLRNIREFLENLSTTLAGGPIEGVKVAPLYNHPSCIPDRRRSTSSPSAPGSTASTASSAHAALKRLVARVVEEAAAMPALAQYAAEPPSEGSVENSTYEDLLATAILNKVIERYQTENGSGGRSSSGIHSASASPTTSERSSPRSLKGRILREITPPLEEDEGGSDWEGGDETLDLPRRVPFPEFGGDIIHGTESDDREFDDASGSDLQAADGSWEENWLFQKKKIKTQSVPVPMLVPNSNADYRALIGGQDAEDISDLSDNNTDMDEEEVEYQSDIKNALDSQHVIGGRTKLDGVIDFEPESLTSEDIDYQVTKAKNTAVIEATNDEADSSNVDRIDTVNKDVIRNTDESVLDRDVDSGPMDRAEFSVKEEIHRNLNGYKSYSNLSTSVFDEEKKYKRNKDLRNNTLNGHEKEGEYEETVTVPVQRYADSLRRKHFEEDKFKINSKLEDDDLIPGSIAERERKKWLNYVEMPNNPYSPEAIQRRLSARSTSSIFDMITKGDIEDKKMSTDTIDGISEGHESDKKVGPKRCMSVNSNLDHTANENNKKVSKDGLETNSPQYKRYGRDYYIKEAKISAGGRKRSNMIDACSLPCINKSTSLDNFDSELCSTGFLIQQFNTIATNQQYTNFEDKKGPYKTITLITSDNDNNNTIINPEIVDEQTLFSAKPVLINDETENQFNEILKTADSEFFSLDIEIETKNDQISPKSPSNESPDQSFVSTSSLDDSLKIYNIETGKVMKGDKSDNVSDMLSRRYGINKQDSDSETPVVTTSRKDVDDVMPVLIREIARENQLDSIAEEEIQLPKVKELAKKFFSMDDLDAVLASAAADEDLKPKETKRRKSKDNLLDTKPNKQVYMHSLTARSISREFREELRMSMPRSLKTPGGTNELPEGIEEVSKESSRPGSPLPEPGTIKTKLAFFESLKAKFSSK